MRWPLRVGVIAALVFLPSLALAQEDSLACIDANAEAQKLERAGKLRDATTKLVACANASCPAAVRSDCAVILARVEAAQGSIIIDVHDEAGVSTTRARVTIDDTLVPEASMGRAIIVDPGPHVIVAELATMRRETRTVSVEGEKGKHVAIDFTVSRPEARDARFTVPWLSWALAGLSVLSAGTSIYFGVTGNGIKNRLDTTCRASTSCASSEYFDMATSYNAANVFAAVAVGSIALAVVTAIFWPRPKRSNTMSMIVHGVF